ncbi:putative tyrosine-protein phosphatase non-receptor type 14-like [Penaeus vannamei]|uniref:Putative tyrosine-protein phosphatase non-receptor type 14-like n=1 Tax=Penaeus vannamei TaxID=6689 RepID=A0A423T9V1_PENVA|nr:putative tyrosine-protein phosphatase non-receptor type 14-like [Penaeus vannamei]
MVAKQQVKQSGAVAQLDAGSEGARLTPRKKWGAPATGPVMLAGQAEPAMGAAKAVTESYPAGHGEPSAKGQASSLTPDVLRGTATPSQGRPKDPRAVQLENKLFGVDILQEFESLPRVKPNADFTTAQKSDNIPRNRYKDIVPYEENRVRITPSKENKSGYINASHITASVGESQRFYLCAQGPLANTVTHFWQCVWEADVHVVVMLTSVTGDTNTSKSFPYWPQMDNTSVECGEYRVFRKHSTVTGSHITSRLQLIHAPTRKTRTATAHRKIGLAVLKMCRDLYASWKSYQHYEDIHTTRSEELAGTETPQSLCTVQQVLHHLRQQRMALVQTIAQYKFVYQVLIAYLNRARLI